MTAKDRHASAATHHEQAARFHREASRHFEIGKDPAHWAHQALLAHGHTLQAMEYGKEARNHYARHQKPKPPEYTESIVRFPSNARETAEAMETILQEAQRHARKCVFHSHEAAKQHVKQHLMLGSDTGSLRLYPTGKARL